MPLRERSHATYLQPEAKADVVEQKELAANDNDRPKTAFEATVEQIRKEYSEAETLYTESQQQLSVLENDLQQLWKEIEGVGLATQASASLIEEYNQLQSERQALTRTATELSQKLDQLRLEYEPFNALQEGISSYHASSAESFRLRGREQELHAKAAELRQVWAEHEPQAEAELAKIDQDDEFAAATQRAVIAELEDIKRQRDRYEANRSAAEDPRYAHVPEYQQWKQYFQNADAWVVLKMNEVAQVTAKREELHTRRQAIKAKGKDILAQYDACIEEQMTIAERLPALEYAKTAAEATYQYGVTGAGEVMQARGTISSTEPRWVNGARENSSPNSFSQAA